MPDERKPQPDRTGRYVGDGLRETYRAFAVVVREVAALARKDKDFDVVVGPVEDEMLSFATGVWVQGAADDVETMRVAVEKRMKVEKVDAVWTYYQPSSGDR